MTRKLLPLVGAATLLSLLAWFVVPSAAQKGEKPPHGQDKVPGPPLSPQEALKKMTVPPGFHVELVAAVRPKFDAATERWIERIQTGPEPKSPDWDDLHFDLSLWDAIEPHLTPVDESEVVIHW